MRLSDRKMGEKGPCSRMPRGQIGNLRCGADLQARSGQSAARRPETLPLGCRGNPRLGARGAGGAIHLHRVDYADHAGRGGMQPPCEPYWSL